MIDIHCHILPGIDDGPTDLETAVGMCREAVENGITHIVATPHCNDEYLFDVEAVGNARDRLQQACGPSPVLLTGCDFHLSAVNLDLLAAFPTRYTVAQKNHLLLENSNYSLPPNLEQILFRLRCRGIVPVLTHPERNPLLLRKPDLLRRLAQQECVIQVTAGAFLGRFGQRAQKFAFDLLSEGILHVVASDAHNLSGRPLHHLREALEKVSEEAGSATAELLFEENPRSIIEGHPCRPPEPLPRKRHWGFLGR